MEVGAWSCGITRTTDIPYFPTWSLCWVWKLSLSLLVLFVTEPHCVAQADLFNHADSISRELGLQV